MNLPRKIQIYRYFMLKKNLKKSKKYKTLKIEQNCYTFQKYVFKKNLKNGSSKKKFTIFP